MAQERAEYQPTNQQFFEAHAVIGMLLDDMNPDMIRAHVEDSNAAGKQAIFEFLTVVDPELNNARCEPIAAWLWRDPGIREKFLAHQGLWPKERRELFRRRMESRIAGTATASHPVPQRATDLLAEAIPLPVPIVDNLMHEGMLLLGGKSKRGKSWLMLDLALAVSTGRPVWGHFAVSEPQPVLYLALEDGKARVQRRLRAIQPDIEAADNLHLLYDFSLLTDGGIERLAHYVESGRFRLVVIDVLAKVEPVARGGSEKGYHDI